MERNWRCREGEADIIARDPEADALVVVEVKTRAGTGYGSPLDAITFEKARRLRWLAAIYARQSGRRVRRLRVDAIGILWPRGQRFRLTHVRGIEER
nr:YraN family protein [Tessaracoccus coleopterorum]